MMISVGSLFSVFIGGGLGAVSRWLLSFLAMHLRFGPWVGTLVANVIGCLLIFVFTKYFMKDYEHLSLLIKVGFLGGLTTFSSFALEAVGTFLEGRYYEAFLIFILNIFLGIIIGFAILR